MPMVGRASRQTSRMSPTWRAPISHKKISWVGRSPSRTARVTPRVVL